MTKIIIIIIIRDYSLCDNKIHDCKKPYCNKAVKNMKLKMLNDRLIIMFSLSII